MTISHVIAASENNAIGKDNQLLWHLPNDMRFFKNTTWGSVVIMGRKSFESMGKALKGRINIVITRQDNWQAEDAIVAKDLQDALKKAEAANCKEIFIIGGGEIYKQSLGIADKIYLTRVHTIIEGDTYFPELDKAKWELTSNEYFKKDEKHQYDYSFQIWTRK